jgi:hypothetical protein
VYRRPNCQRAPLYEKEKLLVLFSDVFIISYNKTLTGSFMNKELARACKWSRPIPRTLGFSWNKENHRNAIKVANPRGQDLNLKPAENKTAGASIYRPTTPFCDAARAISGEKEMPLVGLCLILRCYRNINL